MSRSESGGAIGIDVGGTNLRLALLDQDGKIVKKVRLATDIHKGREDFLQRLADAVRDLLAFASEISVDIQAIGLGIPGLIGQDGLVHVSVNLQQLEGSNPAAMLQDLTGIKTVSINDANAIAVGEYYCGAGREFDTFLMLTIGTGLGSGLILKGQLWTGCDGVAGEFGHVTVEPEGRPCPCGNTGCLEQYVSATALVRQALERSILVNGHSSDESITSAGLAVLARSGDPKAGELFAEAGRYLGIAVASFANLINPQAVLIGGGVADSLDLMLPALQLEVRSRAYGIPAQRLKIVKGSLGDDAGLYGSALYGKFYSE